MAAPYSGKQGRVRFTSATATSSTDNAATLSTDGITLTIDDTAKVPWDRSLSTAVHVYDGSTEVTTFGVKNYALGVIEFSTPRSTANTYTIDCETLSASYLGSVRGWSFDVTVGLTDVTTFSTSTADTQWREFTPTVSGGSITLDRLVASDSTAFFAYDRLNLGLDVVLELIVDGTTGDRLVAFGRINRDSFAAPVDGPVTEDVEVMVDGPVGLSTR